MPTTYGFSWIDIGPKTNDWRYIEFGWDNIFASYTAGVLGYKEAAYSNLIGIIMAKGNDGFVPNHAAGGAISSGSEPANGGKVLLDLYQRFKDDWIVELLCAFESICSLFQVYFPPKMDFSAGWII